MDYLITSLVGILQVTLLDLALCGDNIGIIALATKDLPKSYAKKASAIGVAGAVGLRILFACGITLILAIQWLPIKLAGGLLLVKITWDFIKPKEEEVHQLRSATKFWSAIWTIIIADVSMSLDNVLAIAGAANGRIDLIIFGILLNIPIIFFGSQFVARLMEKHAIVIYIGGAILAHTSFKMILEDRLTQNYLHLSHSMVTGVPLLVGVLTLIYGFYQVKKAEKKPSESYKGKHHKEIAATKDIHTKK